MYAATPSTLINDLSTGSLGLLRVAETHTGATDRVTDFFENESTPVASNILTIKFSSGFSISKHYSFNQLDKAETILTETQLHQEESLESSIANSIEARPVYEQLAQVKQCLGLNILELASILQVSRPTVYGWIESRKTIRKKNQERLNSIYEISKAWSSKHIGRLGSHLHKPIGASNISLFDLLKSNNLNLNKIQLYLNTIAQTILKKRQEDEAQEALLIQHGFEPTSKEDMEDRLHDIDFLD